MTRSLLPFLILAAAALIALISGCATYGYEFVDADGTNVAVHDTAFLAKRDLADTASNYEWTPQGGGNWTIGQTMTNTDATQAIPMLQSAFSDLARLTTSIIAAYFAAQSDYPPTPASP